MSIIEEKLSELRLQLLDPTVAHSKRELFDESVRQALTDVSDAVRLDQKRRQHRLLDEILNQLKDWGGSKFEHGRNLERLIVDEYDT